jgi:undecaprenyl-diphosphatase
MASMFFVDAAALTAVAGLAPGVRLAFSKITDFGLSGWFLIPLGVLLVSAAILDGPWLQRWSRLLLAALVVRLGFLFVAIAIPGILNNILKRLIGRARPSEHGPFFYEPLTWRAAFEGMPSGHATTAFSVLVAFGAMFPRLRWLFWIYALVIAMSRVVVGAHYPSDVLAGAALGAAGALCIRDWFARRRLGFHIGSDGQIRRLPGPSRARLKGVARRLFAP